MLNASVYTEATMFLISNFMKSLWCFKRQNAAIMLQKWGIYFAWFGDYNSKKVVFKFYEMDPSACGHVDLVESPGTVSILILEMYYVNFYYKVNYCILWWLYKSVWASYWPNFDDQLQHTRGFIAPSKYLKTKAQ